jgi:hypothetical protein
MRWYSPAMRTLLVVLLTSAMSFAANVPRPLSEHPGNLFLADEKVVISAPAGEGEIKIIDYESKPVAFDLRDGHIALESSKIGYYEVRRGGGPKTTIGVIAPLAAPTPSTSPIGIDVAMAWFYFNEHDQRAAANLCNLAGINWVRDRLNWTVMEPQREKFADHNIYDDAARIQSEAGLKILQVNHISPPWANSDGRRFPLDLRDAYRFYREMAKRWKGQVLAIEPWNEADIAVFGGHTGSEIASMQKAAYLGLKAGNPDVIACQNVFATDRKSTLDDFAANEVSAYFDTYNLHHYRWFDQYPEMYARHRAVSAGKPMWVTECNTPVKWAGDEKLKEPTDADLRLQAELVAKVYVSSLHEGSVNTFYFMLPDYVEGQTQYGVLHKDLTPRPAYIALAAVGRLLADAKPMGRWKSDDADVNGYLFRAKPDGAEKQILVAWRNKGEGEVTLRCPVEHVIDHLGRETPQSSWIGQLKLTRAPVFAIIPAEMKPEIKFDPPPVAPARNDAKPSPIVMQPLIPPDRIEFNRSAFVMPPDQANEITIQIYNFGDGPAHGTLTASAQPNVKVDLQHEIDIPAGDRVAVKLVLAKRAASSKASTIKIKGVFGDSLAVLSLRVIDAHPTAQPAG